MERNIDEIYGRHAEMCKVFSHPKRLELIGLLRDEEMSVSGLAEKLAMAPANVSQHLAMMRERHILVSRKEGHTVFYRVRDDRLLQVFDMLRTMLFDQMRQDASLADGRSG